MPFHKLPVSKNQIMLKREPAQNFARPSMAPRNLGFMLVAAFAGQSLLPGANAQVIYTVTDLGAQVFPVAINNRGQIAGTFSFPNSNGHAFLYQKGIMTDLGTLPGDNSSAATAINNIGNVVGSSDNPLLPGAPVHAFLYNGKKMIDVGTGGNVSGINNSGDMIGGWVSHSGTAFNFVFKNGGIQDLGTFPTDWSYSVGGINDAGEVAGFVSIPGGAANAFTYRNRTRRNIGNFQPTAINDHGQMVGFTPNEQAVFYSAGHLLNLGTLPGTVQSQAASINNREEIVGFCSTNSHSQTIPFLFLGSQMFALTDLLVPNSGWTIGAVFGINDSGQIIGQGIFNGTGHGFVLNPSR
jgi:probable HAF family extracellular repeat protein